MTNLCSPLDHILSLREAEQLNQPALSELREKRMRMLLKHAFENSPFYKKLYTEQGITLEKIANQALSDFPFVNKPMLMSNFDEVITRPNLTRSEIDLFLADPCTRGAKYKNEFQILHTSGTSGTIGVFVFAPAEWTLIEAMAVTRVSRTKPLTDRKLRLSYVGATDGHYAGVSLALDAPTPFFESQILHIGRPLEEIIHDLNEFRPDTLSGYASGAQLLAEEALVGHLKISPKKIICSGDPLTKPAREVIKSAFGVEPTNLYAATEALTMGADCEQEHRLHLFTDWHCFEIVDSNGRAVPNGTVGSLVVTNLYNKTMPLIRYHINDRMSIDSRPCPCGSPFPVLKEIGGRVEDPLWFKGKDGKRIMLQPIVIDFFIHGVSRFQFEQISPEAVILRIIGKGDIEKIAHNTEERLVDILREHDLEKTVKVSIEMVSEIKNDPRTGKARTIIGYKW